MNYREALNFINSLHNLPAAEYLKNKNEAGRHLKRLQSLLDLLGNPEKKIPHFIHVTGTSGKGSVCIFLSRILRAAGKKTGLLTSPHPSSITERWEINNSEIGKNDLARIVGVIKGELDRCARTSRYGLPSPFEIFTAMGLYYFAEKRVEWAVIEVGCGGKHDSTNIIPRKDAAVITNIGLDHVGVIGADKKEIAEEKSGIIKKGSAVFTSEKSRTIYGIIRREAEKRKCRISRIINPAFRIMESGLKGTNFNYKENEYFIPLIGRHQVENAILAIEVARFLKIPAAKIANGLAKAKAPIRMEVASRNPLIILDGAHNRDKMRSTINTVGELTSAGAIRGRIILLAGFSGNKDIKTMTMQLASLKPRAVVCTRYTINPFRKVADPYRLAETFRRLLPGTKVLTFIEPKDALDAAIRQRRKRDALLVTGSMFLAGELRPYFGPRRTQN